MYYNIKQQFLLFKHRYQTEPNSIELMENKT